MAWFREGREILQSELESRFAAAHPNLPTPESLLSELPRTAAHRNHLMSGASLPVEAFRGAGALEMLCYLSLQSLPRHSRVYANLHLSGGWHDQIELRSVYTAVLEHAPTLLDGLHDGEMAKRSRNMNTQHAMDADLDGLDALGDQDVDLLAGGMTPAAAFASDLISDGSGVMRRGSLLQAAAAKVAHPSPPPPRERGSDASAAGDADDASDMEAFRRAALAGGDGLDAGSGDDETAPLSPPKTPMGKSGKAKAVDFSLSAWQADTRNARREEERKRSALARGLMTPGSDAAASGVKATWAEREAEAFGRKLGEDDEGGAPSRRGLFARLLFGDRRDVNGQGGEGGDDADAVGWFYMDDFGREQGPFSTERMRAWMRKGFLTDERQVRRRDVEEWRPLYDWQELDVMAVAQKARRRWKMTAAKVMIGKSGPGGLDSKGRLHLDAISSASQQRYARSSVGFDAMLLRIPYFASTPPSSWPPALIDALLLVCELASVDMLSHIVGHFDGTNLGAELLVEMLSLCFWYTRPPVRLSAGLAQALFTPLHLAVQRQWGLVMQKLCVWRRSVAAQAYWELTRVFPERSADYAHALQFVDWSPADPAGANALAEFLHHQLQLAKGLEGDAQLHHTRALTFTIEQLRLPMLPPHLAEQPMAAVHDWCGFAMRSAHATEEAWQAAQQRRAKIKARREARQQAGLEEATLDDDEDEEDEEELFMAAQRADDFVEGGLGVRDGDDGDGAVAAGGNEGARAKGMAAVMSEYEKRQRARAEAEHAAELAHVRHQVTILELAVACVVQSSLDFFLVQSPALIEALRPYLWRPTSVEPALHCVLRLLRGCYYPMQPYWTAGANALASSGASLAHRNEAQSVPLGRYSVTMYPNQSTESHLVRLAHLQQVLFPGWAEPRSVGMKLVHMLAEGSFGGVVRAAGIGALSELPHAGQLVEVLAEVVVCMAAHAVQWSVEQIIMPFLKFRKRNDASAAYAMVGMRALALMLDPTTDFTSANARTQRDVPRLLAPAIELMLTAAYAQCGLQSVGMRYYPLAVDTFDGAIPDHWASIASSVVADFGPHPLGDKRKTADVSTVLEMADAQPLAPRSAAQEAEVESQWRAQGMLKLVAYRGGSVLGGTASALKLTYGRCFVGVARLEQWPVTLDPQLIWASHTHGAPGRSLLSHETAFAHVKYVAALANTFPEDGRSVDDWAQLYVYALGVLPLFDPSSIPGHLVVDSEGRSFLVKALAHPDERIARAAAHAMQRIMHHHMALRVPLFKAMLSLLGRVPETDVAVRVTTLAHFVQLISVWIEELQTMDPFKLTTVCESASQRKRRRRRCRRPPPRTPPQAARPLAHPH